MEPHRIFVEPEPMRELLDVEAVSGGPKLLDDASPPFVGERPMDGRFSHDLQSKTGRGTRDQ
jgi:hypothetical protein